MAELEGVRDREAAAFTSALRETFKTIVFPMTKALRRVDDFRMEFDRNDYSGEQQIIDTLTKRGKYIPTDQFDSKFENIRLDAEDLLFDADAVQELLVATKRGDSLGLVLAPEGRPGPTGPHRRPARILAHERRPRREEMGASDAGHRSAG